MSHSGVRLARWEDHADRVGRRTLLALAVSEAKRVLRHPLLLTGAAIGTVLTLVPWQDGEPAQFWVGETYSNLLMYWAPLYFGSFAAANTAALRDRESTTTEMFRACATSRPERLLAVLIAGAAPTLLAAILAAAQLGVVHGAGGITVDLVKIMPAPIEMALVPTITAVSFAAGVAVARTIESSAIGVAWGAITAFVLFFGYWLFGRFPLFFLAPYATSLRQVDLGETLEPDEQQAWPAVHYPDGAPPRWWAIDRNVAIVGWHLAYLFGVALLLAGYAVRRSGADPRVRLLLLAGGILSGGGVALQMSAFGGPFGWWDVVGFA